MGKIKCSLCLKKKQAKKLIFDPKIAMRTERSDPARNHQFCADFLNVAYSVVSFSATVEILNCYIGEAGGSAD
jgi:hypothetical protein